MPLHNLSDEHLSVLFDLCDEAQDVDPKSASASRLANGGQGAGAAAALWRSGAVPALCDRARAALLTGDHEAICGEPMRGLRATMTYARRRRLVVVRECGKAARRKGASPERIRIEMDEAAICLEEIAAIERVRREVSLWALFGPDAIPFERREAMRAAKALAASEDDDPLA